MFLYFDFEFVCVCKNKEEHFMVFENVVLIYYVQNNLNECTTDIGKGKFVLFISTKNSKKKI